MRVIGVGGVHGGLGFPKELLLIDEIWVVRVLGRPVVSTRMAVMLLA
jgi:hypothetical protein